MTSSAIGSTSISNNSHGGVSSITIHSNPPIDTSVNGTFSSISADTSAKIKNVSQVIHQRPQQRKNCKPKRCCFIKSVIGFCGAVGIFALGVLKADSVRQILFPSADSSLDSYNPLFNSSSSSTGLNEGFNFSSTGWDDSLRLSSTGLDSISLSTNSLTSSYSSSSSSTGSSSSLTDDSSSSTASSSVISSSTGSASSLTTKVLGAGARMYMKGADVGSINFVIIKAYSNPAVLCQIRIFFPTEEPKNAHEIIFVEACPEPGYTKVKAASRPGNSDFSQLIWTYFQYFDPNNYYTADTRGLLEISNLPDLHNRSIAVLEFPLYTNVVVGQIYESRACGTIVVRSE